MDEMPEKSGSPPAGERKDAHLVLAADALSRSGVSAGFERVRVSGKGTRSSMRLKI